MALIVCPECGKEFSNLAAACPNCGYPIDEQTKRLSIIASKWNEYQTSFILCSADTQAMFYVKSVVRDLNLYIPQSSEEENLMKSFVTGFMQQVQQYMYNTPQNLERLFSGINSSVIDHLRQFPRCPTCGSYVVSRISGLSRAIGFELWGMRSSKIGKSYKCEKCGYMW